ncbi:MAG TPA: M15 family metallopeptidase [Micromonosporaceae bacterium]|nr:M15 family metallopeptidase [Micromonosporaceae bacterium]
MTILLSDPRVVAVPVRDASVPLVRLDEGFGRSRALVRADLAERLQIARRALPDGILLHVIEGYRCVEDQQAIIAGYSAELRAGQPGLADNELHRLTSRFVAPVEVAPHVAAAAVDVTLVGRDGLELDMGTPVDATPEASGGACFFAAEGIGAEARVNRDLLARVLEGAGLVNYPTEWWHWSYGDRYWALMTNAAAAMHGPITAEQASRSLLLAEEAA